MNKQTLFALLLSVVCVAQSAAETLLWRGPTHTLTIGLSEEDISHVEFPEPITNVTLEDDDYVDILVVEGYQNRAFRMRSLLPKMATRMFLTGASGKTYVAILTTDVPYRTILNIKNADEIEKAKRKAGEHFGPMDLIRGMANDEELAGVMRETYVIPDWFTGAGLIFDLTEIWQTSKYTGLVVHVRNTFNAPNEVNIPAVTVPMTDEWGELRFASMENMRLAPAGNMNDKGLLYMIFTR